MRSQGFFPSRRLSRWRCRPILEVNPWPFQGFALTVLIIFLIFPINSHRGYAVDLPTLKRAAMQPNAGKYDAMVIHVTRDGRTYFGNIEVANDKLPELIRSSVEQGSERRIYMAVDARALYGDAKLVLDKIGETQVHDVTFLVATHAGEYSAVTR